ncbi:chitobiase/beta-hexosaminidase C-terminal domain-containing protein, partial [Archangium sp.]|uniref:chitobiase/beta-hexosaminidase C-terminal domain-containing protein n=1 Tax=Archangium sp. TaxID=1872627 RepID=UPI002ED8BF25
MTHSWTARCASTLLVLQLASACDSKPPAPPPADTDTTAPSTRASPAGGAYTAGVTVSLLCDDGAGSGCAATHYTTDGSEPSRTSPTFQDALPVSANTTLKFFSVDKRGNAESVKSQVYTFPSTGGDTQPPTVSASPPGGTYDGARTVTLTCDDAGGSGCAALHYTLDGATPTTGSPRYTGPLSLSANTTLRFFAMDAAGNLASVHTERYVIDLLAPTTTARPAGGTYNSRQDVTLSCDDGVGTGCAATHYTLNGATPTPLSPRYTEGTVLPISANTTLKFLSVDAAGHTEPVQTQTYVIDTTPPTTTASPGAGTYGGTRNVTLSCADEAGSGCKVTYYTTNGTAPGPGSPQYEAGKPLPITANTVVRFLSVDHAGNTESVQVLEYKIDVLPPVTTASPAGGAYNAARDVTLACTDATSTCEATYYTLDGTTPDTHSTRYEDTPLRIATSATLKFFSVDAVGNVEPVRTETYVFPDIAAVRAAEVGPIELPIERVLVTYVKPKTDTDPAGFFLQSRKNGPALFVAVDPATLSPSPLPGDRVSLVATTKDMVAGQTRVTSLQSDSFVVHGRGESLAPLLSDASAADLVARLEDYESEYLTVSGTLSSPFGTSGVGHMQASLSTVGNPHTPGTFTDLKLRMPTPLLTALRDRYDLKQGCSITTTGPLWRYFATAQP